MWTLTTRPSTRDLPRIGHRGRRGKAALLSPADDLGFTLIEAVVAIAIFAIAFGGLFRAFDGGWRGVRSAEAEREAVEVARSKLAAVGFEVPLAEGRTAGLTSHGTAWEIEIRRHPAAGDRDTARPAAPPAFAVTVRTRRPSTSTAGAPAVVLETVMLGGRP